MSSLRSAWALAALRAVRDFRQIVAEVLLHLTGQLGAKVQLTVDIQAEVPDGASEQLIRTVTENCHALRFTSHGFEEP